MLAVYDDIMTTAEGIQRGINKLGLAEPNSRWFMVDVGIVPPMHFLVFNCPDQGIRARAYRLLSTWPRQENFWDSQGLRRLLWTFEKAKASKMPLVGLARGLSFSGSIPALEEKLAELKIAVEDDDA